MLSINTCPEDMKRAADKFSEKILKEDPNVIGVLIRTPLVDSSQPKTSDVDLLVLTKDKPSMTSVKRIGDLVFIDFTIGWKRLISPDNVFVDAFQESSIFMVDPSTRASVASDFDVNRYEVFKDPNGILDPSWKSLKKMYSDPMYRRKRALNFKRRSIYYVEESECEDDDVEAFRLAMLGLSEVTGALLEVNQLSTSSLYTKTPLLLRSIVSPETSFRLSQILGKADTAAFRHLLLHLSKEHDNARTHRIKYVVNPVENEYRWVVFNELLKTDYSTAVWYSRAWSDFALQLLKNTIATNKFNLLYKQFRKIMGRPKILTVVNMRMLIKDIIKTLNSARKP